MTAVVTGGAGFIGSHLCDRLLADSQRVLCVDNLLTGSRSNIAHLLDHPRFTFLERDVTQPLEVAAERVYHLASPASPSPHSERSYLRFPVETALANSLGSYHLLELARAHGARLLLASTSEVYGDPAVHPQHEGYWGNVNPIGPRSCYDESKRFAEALAMTYVRKYDLDVRIVRIFNTYGPRMDGKDGRVVPNFIGQALNGQSLTVYGDGSQTRSLCYVEDLVEGLVVAMESPQARGQVVNLGSPEEHSILEYADLIRELCGSSSPLVFLPLPEDDPVRRRPEIAKARAMLGWEPRTGLREGLMRTIEWLRAQLPIPQGSQG